MACAIKAVTDPYDHLGNLFPEEFKEANQLFRERLVEAGVVD